MTKGLLKLLKLLCETSLDKKFIFVFKVSSDFNVTSILPNGSFPESIRWHEAGFKRNFICLIYYRVEPRGPPRTCLIKGRDSLSWILNQNMKPVGKHGWAWSFRALKWRYAEIYFRKSSKKRQIQKQAVDQDSPYAKTKCLSSEFKIQSNRTINGPELLGTRDRLNWRILYSSVSEQLLRLFRWKIQWVEIVLDPFMIRCDPSMFVCP